MDEHPSRARYGADAGRLGPYGVFETADGGRFRHHDRAWIDELLGTFATEAERELELTTMNGNSARGFQRPCLERS